MRNLVLIGSLLFSLNSYSQPSNCLKFHTGIFEINDEHGKTLITRKKKIQLEKMEGQSYSSRLHIKWINECTYTLKPSRRTRKRSGPGIPDDALLMVTINDSQENSYTQTTTSNFFDFEYKSEIIMLRPTRRSTSK